MGLSLAIYTPIPLLSLLKKIYHVPSTCALLGTVQAGEPVLLNLWGRSVICNDWNMLHVMLSSLLYFTVYPEHSNGVPVFVRVVGNVPHPWRSLRVSPRHFDHLKTYIIRELGKTLWDTTTKECRGCRFPVVVIDSDNTNVLNGAIALSQIGVCVITTKNVEFPKTATVIAYQDGYYTVIAPETEEDNEYKNVFLPSFDLSDIASIISGYLHLARLSSI